MDIRNTIATILVIVFMLAGLLSFAYFIFTFAREYPMRMLVIAAVVIILFLFARLIE